MIFKKLPDFAFGRLLKRFSELNMFNLSANFLLNQPIKRWQKTMAGSEINTIVKIQPGSN